MRFAPMASHSTTAGHGLENLRAFFFAKLAAPISRFRVSVTSNYRLVCGTLNSRKGTFEVLDPFMIEDGWFEIDFPVTFDPSGTQA